MQCRIRGNKTITCVTLYAMHACWATSLLYYFESSINDIDDLLHVF